MLSSFAPLLTCVYYSTKTAACQPLHGPVEFAGRITATGCVVCYLHVLARHQVAHSLHCGAVLHTELATGVVMQMQLFNFSLHACLISARPHCGTVQPLASLATTVRLVDVHGVILHINLLLCLC